MHQCEALHFMAAQPVKTPSVSGPRASGNGKWSSCRSRRKDRWRPNSPPRLFGETAIEWPFFATVKVDQLPRGSGLQNPPSLPWKKVFSARVSGLNYISAVLE